jgi:hypothetical protein
VSPCGWDHAGNASIRQLPDEAATTIRENLPVATALHVTRKCQGDETKADGRSEDTRQKNGAQPRGYSISAHSWLRNETKLLQIPAG